jgi:ABC-type molybdate transport system permease subunit
MYLQKSISGSGKGMSQASSPTGTGTFTHSNLQYLIAVPLSLPPHFFGMFFVQFAGKASIIPTHEAKMSAIHFF